MRWVDGDCRIASGLVAVVWESPLYAPWAARVETNAGSTVWRGENFESEAAAKAAVCGWIDRTCTQMQNAKNAGCQPVDEE